jgi:hypothetical protein
VIERGVSFASADLISVLAAQLGIPVAALFCEGKEKVIGADFFNNLDLILDNNLSTVKDSVIKDIQQTQGHP